MGNILGRINDAAARGATSAARGATNERAQHDRMAKGFVPSLGEWSVAQIASQLETAAESDGENPLAGGAKFEFGIYWSDDNFAFSSNANANKELLGISANLASAAEAGMAPGEVTRRIRQRVDGLLRNEGLIPEDLDVRISCPIEAGSVQFCVIGKVSSKEPIPKSRSQTRSLFED